MPTTAYKGSEFKPCYNCIRLRQPAIQFDRGFLCYECGKRDSRGIIRNLTLQSLTHTLLFRCLKRQAAKARNWVPGQEKPSRRRSPEPEPIFYQEIGLGEIRAKVHELHGEWYGLDYLEDCLEQLALKSNGASIVRFGEGWVQRDRAKFQDGISQKGISQKGISQKGILDN